ncbi:MAG TPA: hypothetical protein VFB80_06000 [Pirellulaceae bacterium]|nr:hypothetical protein [Pirellulaceae bacterium]
MSFCYFKLRCCSLIALALPALAGCGNEAQRTPVFKTVGSITFRNQPAVGAFVVLHPKGATAGTPRPTAHVKADGTFEATTFETADGAPLGEYIVTVQRRKLVKQNGDWTPGPNLIPDRYADPATSHLTIRIAEGENNLEPIVLR